MLPALLDQLFVLFQRLLPERQLGSAVRALTRNRTPWLKNLLIRTFVRVYRVDLGEVDHPEPEAWEHMNAFFTRPLRAGARPYADLYPMITVPHVATVTAFPAWIALSGRRHRAAAGQSINPVQPFHAGQPVRDQDDAAPGHGLV